MTVIHADRLGDPTGGPGGPYGGEAEHAKQADGDDRHHDEPGREPHAVDGAVGVLQRLAGCRHRDRRTGREAQPDHSQPDRPGAVAPPCGRGWCRFTAGTD